VVEGIEFELCVTSAFSAYRVSALGLNISTFSFAIVARFNLRINSSLLPENIDPQITSMLPPYSLLRLKISSLNSKPKFIDAPDKPLAVT
jgi:hypothetical protein